MSYDFKKDRLYRAADRPEFVTVPRANYTAVRGRGDPNVPGGAYQQAVAALYAISYALKTSLKKDRDIPAFFDCVVPPAGRSWTAPPQSC